MANLFGILKIGLPSEVDVNLSPLGEQEAKHAGILLRNFIMTKAYTSVLKRSIHILEIVLKEIGVDVSVIKTAALNERNHGDLQGFNKKETEDK